MVAVSISRTDFTAAELRSAAVRADDAQVARRALAIAMVMDGLSRAAAAELSGMDRQTLRDWVLRPRARPRPPPPAASGSRLARSWRGMGWCAGGASICLSGSEQALA